jgi:CRISPR/Cas system-associated exonuclease Cas4 (RecB family)
MKKRAAKRARPKSIKAWSYSTWSNWDNCPRKVYFEKIEGLKSSGSPAMERGSRIHSQVENYLLGKGDLPEECEALTEEFEELLALGVAAEAKICMTEQWALVSWFDPAAWVRGALDWCHWISPTHFKLGDLKTGKIRSKQHKTQMGLYALLAFKAYPKARKVTVELFYCDQDEIHESEYTRKADFKKLEAEWKPRWEGLLGDTEFPATPNPLCGWCDYSAKKGGPCVHG